MGRVREAAVLSEAPIEPAVAPRSKAVVVAAAALCLAGYLFVYTTGRASAPIRADGFSYYVYLPAWFLFHDTTLAAVARDCCGGELPGFAGFIRWPGTRRWVNPHPIGVAVLQLPFFGIAHALTRWSNLSPDGFSLYYQHAAGLAGVAWTIAGLWMLRRLLLRYFTDAVTAATLAVTLLGTNLYHYATYDSSYSHVYSFFLFTSFLYLTDRWHEAATTRRSLLLGLVAGLIVLTRHTNAMLLLVAPLFGVNSLAALRTAAGRLVALRWQIAIAIAAATVVVIPQLAIYYQATGRPFVSSYGSLGFDFGSPQIWGVLFSVQKGLFFWSPVLLLGAAGFLAVQGRARAFLVPGLLILAVHTYLIASWREWWFGGSYGHRGFIDVFPLFAIGLATVFTRTAGVPGARQAVAVACVLLVALSAFQMLQYWYGLIPFSHTSWEHYQAIFLRSPWAP